MAGHSQWANRKHRKARQDAKKGAIFSKMAKKISVAAREGGGDPEANSVLRVMIDEAKQLGVPNDNIDRAIKRGTGELDSITYQQFQYEGYGPGGAALLLDIVSDNRNRTASEIRHIFSKYGGNLGESGCVAWMFSRKGRITIAGDDIDEDELFLAAAEAGAEDLEPVDDGYVVVVPPEDLEGARSALAEAGYEVKSATLVYDTDNKVQVEGKDAEKLLQMLDALEDHEDVQEVFSNFEISDELVEMYGD
ncbi:MAG: YebC/PmpR family DNA-binding transcriptional regulator [Bacillota bacterium]